MKEFTDEQIKEHINLCKQMGYSDNILSMLKQVYAEKDQLLVTLKASIHEDDDRCKCKACKAGKPLIKTLES